MANILFGAEVPVYDHNGNWNDQNQWYSAPGSSSKGGDTPGTLLGRLPTTSDIVSLYQIVTTGVTARVFNITGSSSGVWTGQIRSTNVGGVNDPSATWTSGDMTSFSNFTMRSGTVNFDIDFPSELSGGIINGNVTDCPGTFIGNVTINGGLQGRIIVNGHPTLNGPLTDMNILISATGTLSGTITSWASETSYGINRGAIIMSPGAPGAVYNATSTTLVNLFEVTMYGGTMMQNVFTSATTSLHTAQFYGGTLAFTSNMQLGGPGRDVVVFRFNTDTGYVFPGTHNNMTIYAGPASIGSIPFGGSFTPIGIRFGSAANGKDAGTYTGLITLLPSSLGTPYTVINGGTYTPPVQTLSLSTVAYGTGKGVDAGALTRNWGFSSFTQRVAIAGSADILQSKIA
jgi:hypothetical protein